MIKYEATVADVLFAEKLNDMMKDGGVWGWPATGLIYRFRKSAKLLELVTVDLLDTPQNIEMHERTRAVWAKIGWAVTP